MLLYHNMYVRVWHLIYRWKLFKTCHFFFSMEMIKNTFSSKALVHAQKVVYHPVWNVPQISTTCVPCLRIQDFAELSNPGTTSTPAPVHVSLSPTEAVVEMPTTSWPLRSARTSVWVSAQFIGEKWKIMIKSTSNVLKLILLFYLGNFNKFMSPKQLIILVYEMIAYKTNLFPLLLFLMTLHPHFLPCF